ncbi:hypothetical protein [Nocardioides sp.]|uniref:hypothetical protein n=1 Tax=Nocardioides sp. TaxID=35761 RepID=UPI0039E6AEA4
MSQHDTCPHPDHLAHDFTPPPVWTVTVEHIDPDGIAWEVLHRLCSEHYRQASDAFRLFGVTFDSKME